MNKFSDYIIGAIASFLVSVFLPKHIITLFREFIKFVLNSVYKYWYLSFFIFGLTILVLKKLNLEIANEYIYILTILVTVSFVTSYSIYRKVFKLNKFPNIALYGSFSVKENEYLTIDIDSENLNEKIEKENEKINSTFFTFREKRLESNIQDLPKFIPILLGNKSLNRFIKKRVESNKHLASIHFIRDINKQNISVIFNVNKEYFVQGNIIENTEKLISNLCSDSNNSNLKIVDISLKFFHLIFGQSIIDLMINFKQYTEVHYILNDTEKLISDIKNDSENLNEKHKNSINDFITFWSGYIERYKSILLIEQEQLNGAIQHIFKSIELSPYYPYQTYLALKQDYAKKYGITLANSINDFSEFSELEIDKKNNIIVQNNLKNQVQYLEATFNSEIVKNILLKNPPNEILELIVSELEKLDKKNPFLMLTKSEIIKYVKKGNEKYNEIFVERFDETIETLKLVQNIDSDFPLITTKIGIMIAMKGMHYDNEKLIEEGLSEYKKGMHFMNELGFKN